MKTSTRVLIAVGGGLLLYTMSKKGSTAAARVPVAGAPVNSGSQVTQPPYIPPGVVNVPSPGTTILPDGGTRTIDPSGSQTIVSPNGTVTDIAAPTPAIYSDGSQGNPPVVNPDGSVTYTHAPITYNYGSPGYSVAAPTAPTYDGQPGYSRVNPDGSVTYSAVPLPAIGGGVVTAQPYIGAPVKESLPVTGGIGGGVFEIVNDVTGEDQWVSLDQLSTWLAQGWRTA